MSLIDIRRLNVSFREADRLVSAVPDLSLSVAEKSIVGLVVESGSGKSVTALAILRLLSKRAHWTAEAIEFGGLNLAKLDDSSLSAIRGRDIAMIFQEPMNALNPLLTIGRQLEEVLREHNAPHPETHRRRVLDTMSSVGLSGVEELFSRYPHELSGGMLQRVLIAMATIFNPKLIIADEPTTALDVTLQAQILELLKRLNRESNTSILFISHDLAVVRSLCQRVVVLYLGLIMESGETAAIIDHPRHPYTAGLIASLPSFQSPQILPSIPGRVPGLSERPRGCPFNPRCLRASDVCREVLPELVGTDRQWRCHHPLED